MKRKDFMEKIQKQSVNKLLVKEIEGCYGKYVPEIIYKILSFSSKPELFDENETRTLSKQEILQAESLFKVPFCSKKLIPIAEVGTNDYIVFNGNVGKWYIYNILDEILFDEKEKFEDIFMS